MVDKSPTTTRRYERPVIRTIGEREMFEDVGRPSAQSIYGQTTDWSGQAQNQARCWPSAWGQNWPWGVWPPATGETGDEALRVPLYRIVEENDYFLIQVELPGADPADIDVYVGRSDIVVTTACSDDEATRSGFAQNYYGTLELRGELDPDKVETSCSNGVLHLKLFKTKSTSRKHLKVSPSR
jgi:HSP20 family molecular chaperone IbpA